MNSKILLARQLNNQNIVKKVHLCINNFRCDELLWNGLISKKVFVNEKNNLKQYSIWIVELIEQLSIWFLSLGDEYGVNPIIFGVIYIGAIPFFTLSIAWLVKNHKQNRPIVMPMFSATFFFISAYLYLFIAGENVPGWIYAVVVTMLGYGVWVTFKKVRAQIDHDEDFDNGK